MNQRDPNRPRCLYSMSGDVRYAGDLRGSQIAGLNLAVLAEYGGLRIGAGQQASILEQLGIEVSPD